MTLLLLITAFAAGCCAVWQIFTSVEVGWHESQCTSCGYDLRGRRGGFPQVCPECGRAITGSSRGYIHRRPGRLVLGFALVGACMLLLTLALLYSRP